MDIAVLGPVELRADAGVPVPVAGARLRTLLLLLALDAGRVVSAGRLVDGIWGDDPPATAANALQALVSRLRRVGLEVESAAAGYRLLIDPDRVDAHRFTRLAAGAGGDVAALREALALWRGPLEFPDMARATAARLEGLRLTVLQERIAADLRSGAGDSLVPELEELTAAHPLHEPFAALLMRALAAAGRPGRALEVYERTRRELAESLGADPSPALTELHLELLRAEQPASRPRGNLPAAVSSFVGRDADVRSVRELIAAHRLVTLTGPGGSGKTRLSVEVGSALAGAQPDGVWRVELAPVTDAAEVPQTILTALGLRSQVLLQRPGRPPVMESVPALQRLREALAGKHMVVILDNCEHLIGAAAEVADAVLRAAPGLRLLATSREPLGIPGEQLWPVEPLALPPGDADPATAAGFPAVRLLVDRAAGFTLTASTTAAAVRICRALDGMPLAIELAAARLRTLPVDVLSDRLADRFRLLTGGSRTALPRHRTLRAVVDWSWDLLTDAERELWRRFAVFHGGAQVTAVERVCGADIDLLGALVDKSLLVLGADGRYRMLETIREYGLERLAEAGETERLRLAHAAYLLALADEAEPQLRGPDQLHWLNLLTAEHDNLHTAVRAAIEAGDVRTAMALTARLSWYWWLRGHRAEGARIAQEVLAMPGEASDGDRTVVHIFAGVNGLEGASTTEEVQEAFFAAERLAASPDNWHPAVRLLPALVPIFRSGSETIGLESVESLYDDPDPWLRSIAKLFVAQLRLNFGQSSEVADAAMREALTGFRALGERWGIGFTLSLLGDLAAARGDFEVAVSWQREAIALVREVGVREDLPQLEVKLAHQLWLSGDHAEARRMLKQARLSAEDVGLSEVMVSVEYGYATIAREEGDLQEARDRLEAAAAVAGRSTFVPQFHATLHSARGMVAAASGDLATAREFHRRAVETAVESRDSPVVAITLVGVADLVLRCGDPEHAARLLGAADGIRGSRDRTLSDVDRISAQARAALGDAGFSRAYQQGAAVTTATALAATGLTPGA